MNDIRQYLFFKKHQHEQPMSDKIVYKLTDENGRTHNDTQWGPNISHSGTGEGGLCGPGFIHYYDDPLLAVFFNPIHVEFKNPLLWEAKVSGLIQTHFGTKSGAVNLTTIRKIPVPTVTLEDRVRFAILCVLEVHNDPVFVNWANSWLSGANRSAKSAQEMRGYADFASYDYDAPLGCFSTPISMKWWAAQRAAEAAEALELWHTEISTAPKKADRHEKAVCSLAAESAETAVSDPAVVVDLIGIARKATDFFQSAECCEAPGPPGSVRFENLVKEVVQLKTDKQNAEHLTAELDQARKQVENLDSANEWQAARLKALGEAKQTAECIGADSRRQLAETRDRCKNLELEKNALSKSLSDAITQRDSVKTQYSELAKSWSDACVELGATRGERDGLTKSLHDLRRRNDELTKQLADAKFTSLTLGPSEISFDAFTGEPVVGFQVGDVWESSDGKRTILSVDAKRVVYSLNRLGGSPPFNSTYTRGRASVRWDHAVEKLLKFTRTIK